MLEGIALERHPPTTTPSSAQSRLKTEIQLMLTLFDAELLTSSESARTCFVATGPNMVLSVFFIMSLQRGSRGWGGVYGWVGFVGWGFGV